MNEQKTKTYRYLFEPTITLFHAPEVRSLLLNEKQGFKIIDVFIADSAIEDSKPEDGIFYILVDRTHNNFAVNIEKLKKKSMFYVDNYLIGSLDSNYAIIRFNSFKGKILDSFLSSKYSEMYEKQTLVNFKSRFQKVSSKGKLEPTKEYQVLTCSTTLKNEIIDSIKAHDNSDISYLNEIIVELDSKINFQNEIIDSETYGSTRDKD